MKLTMTIFLLMISVSANAGEPLASRVEPYFMYQHQSDILRGPPFFNHNDRPDPTNDYIAFGMTIKVADRWELDISHGWKSFDCSLRKVCKWETGTEGAIKWYPWRKKR